MKKVILDWLLKGWLMNASNIEILHVVDKRWSDISCLLNKSATYFKPFEVEIILQFKMGS